MNILTFSDPVDIEASALAIQAEQLANGQTWPLDMIQLVIVRDRLRTLEQHS